MPAIDEQTLNEKLRELHTELGRTEAVEEPTRALLQSLEQDIRTVLERSGEITPAHYQPLVQRLPGALEHFEIAHPSLAVLIQQLLDTLSQMGI